MNTYELKAQTQNENMMGKYNLKKKKNLLPTQQTSPTKVEDKENSFITE